jgi:hypothetical protein
MKRWFDEIGQTFIAPQNKLPTLSTGLRRFVSFSCPENDFIREVRTLPGTHGTADILIFSSKRES